MTTANRYAVLALSLIVALALGYIGHRIYAAGESHVQAQWDAEKASQAAAVAEQATKAKETEQAQSTAFAGIEQTYLKSSTYAQDLATSTADAVSDGTLRVRFCAAESRPSGHPVSTAAGGSRIADEAATQSLADSVQAAIAAVRAGDDADAREQQLRQQVIALQAVIKAERAKQ